MSRPRIITTRRLPATVEHALSESFEVTLATTDDPWTPAALHEALATSDGMLITVADKFPAELLTAPTRRARILANFGVGVDHIDGQAASAHDVMVTNTPDVLTDCTADLTLALMLALLRRTTTGEQLLRRGEWGGLAPMHHLGHRVAGRTLGLVGFGRIGQAVARRASHGFGMTVLAAGRRPLDPARCDQLGVEECPVPELLRRAEIVSLHCASTAETRDMVGAEWLAAMRPGSWLINTARGDLLDDEAVLAALDRGHLAGVGLDVFRNEPALHPGYLLRDNAVLLPHLGSATLETREAIGLRAVANLRAFFAGETPQDVVHWGQGLY